MHSTSQFCPSQDLLAVYEEILKDSIALLYNGLGNKEREENIHCNDADWYHLRT